MITAKITGKLTEIGEITTLPNSPRQVQRIQIQTQPQPDSLGRFSEAVSFYDVFIYGKNEIFNAWNDYRKEYPAPIVTAVVYLIGRIKYDKQQRPYNNITLRLKQIIYHYGNTETHYRNDENAGK